MTKEAYLGVENTKNTLGEREDEQSYAINVIFTFFECNRDTDSEFKS